jgi:pyrroloquinoline quinone biosynthesis protein B
MGHLPQRDHLVDGTLQRGMMTVLASLPARHRMLVHINNTNPVLDEDSPERRELERHGIGVAHDGMEIVL